MRSDITDGTAQSSIGPRRPWDGSSFAMRRWYPRGMLVSDVYDDEGALLHQKLGSQVKVAAADPSALARLPDRLFACVYTDELGHRVRKLATHDPGHLASSLIYFMDQQSRLPVPARQKIAANLVSACLANNINPPNPLIKIAVAGAALGAGMAALGVADAVNASRDAVASKQNFMDQFRSAQAQNAKVAEDGTVESARAAVTPRFEEELSITEDRQVQRGGEVPESVKEVVEKSKGDFKTTASTLPAWVNQLDQKTADLQNTEIQAPAGLKTPLARERPADMSRTALGKTSSFVWSDLHLSELQAPQVAQPPSFRKYASPMQKKYPIDTPEQVKRACAYFDEHWRQMPPAERRIFAHTTTEQAEALGLSKVASDTMLSYAGTEYGPFLESELQGRIYGTSTTGRCQVYEVLLEKRASIPPSAMVELLKEADQATGIDRQYSALEGNGFRDYYRAVYGAKLASRHHDPYAEFAWSSGSSSVTGDQLKSLVKSSSKLDHVFGSGFAEEYGKDPLGVFNSMPDPQKVVLAKLAMDGGR